MTRSPLGRLVLYTMVSMLAARAAQAQSPRLDGRLSDLVDTAPNAAFARVADAIRSRGTADGVTDSDGRILVDIYLDGSVGVDEFVAQLQARGADVTGVNPSFGFGAVSAFVPVQAITDIADGGGLNLMKMTFRPQHNVGAVTSQGAAVMRSDVVNSSGFSGAGITVGVLSDSYNTSPATFTAIRAANDIASGDLPVPQFVIDFTASPNTNTDEGRAMMQIVHDVAPSAALCFATAFAGEASFAANIRTLRTNPSCAADVIVDDVFYFDEPFFSDGQVAQAVNDVSTSSSLAGKKVAYFSSAGNQGGAGGGGSIDVPSATFSTTPTGLGNINLASAATCTSSPSSGSTKADVAGGWLDFGGGTYAVTVNYSSAGSTLVLQWDDPFYVGAVTSDLNWYLFNSAGACVFTFAANNFTTNNGIEFIGLSGGPSGAYRIMVARTTPGTHLAKRVRMVSFEGFSGGPFSVASHPTTFGHSAAASASSVAAYRYTNPASQQSPFVPAFEPFSSPGPVTIAFDANNIRLASAEVRKKPDLAAPDGVNTTFFFPGTNLEGDGFPNFFGTSAAAPHAAGVAALLLGKAGGPASLTPKQIKSLLQTTTTPRIPPGGSGSPVRAWSVFDGFGLIDAVNALGKIP